MIMIVSKSQSNRTRGSRYSDRSCVQILQIIVNYFINEIYCHIPHVIQLYLNTFKCVYNIEWKSYTIDIRIVIIEVV